MEISVYIDLLLCAAFVLGLQWMADWYRSTRVWIIEDSPLDVGLLKYHLDAPDVAFTYIMSVDDFRKKILSPWLFKKPDLVICDYHLDRGVKGTQIINLCERNGAECLLITGDDSEIFGVDQSKVVRKSGEIEYYQFLSNWIKTREISHG